MQKGIDGCAWLGQDCIAGAFRVAIATYLEATQAFCLQQGQLHLIPTATPNLINGNSSIRHMQWLNVLNFVKIAW